MAKVVAGHRRYNSACKICDLWFLFPHMMVIWPKMLSIKPLQINTI
jgi:hypothetical protein